METGDNLHEYEMEVFDDINQIPKNGHGTNRLLAFICFEGSLQFRIQKESYDLERSQCFICLPKTFPDKILSSSDARVEVFGFSLEVMDQTVYLRRQVLGQLSQLWEPQLIQLTEADLQMIDHMHSIVILQRDMKKRSHYTQMMQCLQQAVFYALADAVNEPAEPEDAESLSNKDRIFKQFLAYLSDSAGRVRSVSAYAEMLNITPKYLSIVVREVSDKTPLQWIHYYTTNVIAQRLTQSGKSIKEIAAELDFPNPSFFGHYVKEHLGLSPKEYRDKFSNA